MRWLSQWRRGPIVSLSVAWIALSAAGLTLYLVAAGRTIERDWNDLGFRLGATSANIHVQWRAMWSQLAALYLTIVLLPAAGLIVLWWQSRRIHSRSSV